MLDFEGRVIDSRRQKPVLQHLRLLVYKHPNLAGLWGTRPPWTTVLTTGRARGQSVLRTDSTVAQRSPVFRLRPDALAKQPFYKNSKIQGEIAMPVRQNQTGKRRRFDQPGRSSLGWPSGQ
jgi:hypothetical protein